MRNTVHTTRALSMNALESSEAIEDASRALAELVATVRGPTDTGVSVEDHTVRSTQSVSRPKDWEVSLVSAVSRALGCVVLWESGRSRDEDYWGRYHVVGASDSAQVADFAVTSLMRHALKERVRFRRVAADSGLSRGPDMTDAVDAMCLRWVSHVLSKLPNSPLAPRGEVGRAVRRRVVELTSQTRAVGLGRTRYEIGRHVGR